MTRRTLQTFHPALSARDYQRMTPHEAAFFTDAPVAHVVARADFIRSAMIEERMRQDREHIRTS